MATTITTVMALTIPTVTMDTTMATMDTTMATMDTTMATMFIATTTATATATIIGTPMATTDFNQVQTFMLSVKKYWSKE